MKTAKKLFAAFLAVMMIAALAIPAFAADTASITVNKTDTAQHTYTAYQIFKGDLSTDNLLSEVQWAESITDNGNKLLEALQADDTLKDIFNDVTESNLDAAKIADTLESAKIINDSDKAQALAEIFETLAKSDYLGAGTVLDSKDTNYFLRVDPGYYLVLDSSTADTAHLSRPVLVVAGEAVIDPKVEEGTPTVVKEADGKSYGIGETVPYTVTFTPADWTDDTTEYKFELLDNLGDNLEPGFTTQANSNSVNSGVKVYIGTVADDGTITKGTEITTSFSLTYNTSEKQLRIYSSDITKITGLSKENVIIAEYSAKVVRDTYDAAKPVRNVVTVNGIATDSEYVYPVNLTIEKVNGQDTTEKLGGAEFKLYKVVDDEELYAKVNENSKNVIEWTTSADEAYTLVTGEDDGTITVHGLAAGDYYLLETKAPGNYNKLEDPVELTISVKENTAGTALQSVTITVGKGATETINGDTAIAQIENNAGATLPSTGGMGTTIFYVVGGILVVGAVVLLVTRKRMDEE